MSGSCIRNFSLCHPPSYNMVWSSAEKTPGRHGKRKPLIKLSYNLQYYLLTSYKLIHILTFYIRPTSDVALPVSFNHQVKRHYMSDRQVSWPQQYPSMPPPPAPLSISDTAALDPVPSPTLLHPEFLAGNQRLSSQTGLLPENCDPLIVTTPIILQLHDVFSHDATSRLIFLPSSPSSCTVLTY